MTAIIANGSILRNSIGDQLRMVSEIGRRIRDGMENSILVILAFPISGGGEMLSSIVQVESGIMRLSRQNATRNCSFG